MRFGTVAACLAGVLIGAALTRLWLYSPQPAPAKSPAETPSSDRPTPVLVMVRTNLPAGVLKPSSSPPIPTNSPEASLSADPTGTESGPGFPRAVQNVFELQVALARQALSPGSIDGVLGQQTRSALRGFQQKQKLPVTGELDDSTRQVLWLSNAPAVSYTVTSNDLVRLQPLSPSWLGKSQQSALDYETLLEMLAEKGEASPSLIQRLNPGYDWARPAAGSCLQLPDATASAPAQPAAFLVIHLSDKILEAFDQETNLLAHFPCSIARRVEKRPVGQLHVTNIALHPNYTFDPANFPESSEALSLKTKLILPPGPNNPVGIAWIGLDKPGYGIHGTPQPEQVGRTESHGCFRLANWNVEYLVRLVRMDTPVLVQP